MTAGIYQERDGQRVIVLKSTDGGLTWVPDTTGGVGTSVSAEDVQDIVGAAMADSASVDFTYDDTAGTITAVVLPAGVDHASLANLTTGDPHTQYVKKATTAAAAGTDILAARVTADTQDRVILNADGTLEWGSGAAVADANLYRNAADQLRTDDFLITLGICAGNITPATGQVRGTGEFIANIFGAGKVRIGTGGAALIYFGSSEDTNLYRSGANALATDDALDVGGALTKSGTAVVITTDSRLSDSRAPNGAAGGDLTGSTYPNPTVAAAAITLAKMSNLAANSFVGNNTGSAATPIALTVAQAKTLLALVKGDVGLGNVDNTADTAKAIAGDVTGTLGASVVGDNSHAHDGTTISALDTGDITTGTMATARLGSGTADANAALGGDQTWKRRFQTVFVNGGAAAWSNQTTQKSVWSATYTIPANFAAVSDKYVISNSINYVNNSGATQTLTIAVLVGAVVLFTFTTPALAASAATRTYTLEVKMAVVSLGATGSFGGSVVLLGTDAGRTQIDATASITKGLLSTIDTTAAQVIDVVAAMSTNTATSTVTPKGGDIEYHPYAP